LSTHLRAAGIPAAANSKALPSTGSEITTFFIANAAGSAEASAEDPPACPQLSAWSQSRAKRIFDCACVLAALPVLIPVLLLAAFAVRLSSRGPVFFLQQRVGQMGRPFTILKFRTLQHQQKDCAGTPEFTAVGPFLRRWKLDELPQLLNVLAGHMSLVGPRPKLRQYEPVNPSCRPGITGAATVVFAREEQLLEQVPILRSPDAYRKFVMPAKYRLDSEYAARATFLSDLRLIFDTLFRRWDVDTLQKVIRTVDLEGYTSIAKDPRLPRSRVSPRRTPLLPAMNFVAPAKAGTDL
jgi:lipopolysaccharide/colanic/teichoic acid biosynthesis glycosyltransferase